MKFKISKQIFVHIDCDSFFAECEILRNPKLKNDFVMVGQEIIVAANYKTKALGIGCGTPIWKAEHILKGRGKFFPGDHKYYQEISSHFMDFLEYNTYHVEPFSIDEAFCEITGLPELYNMSIEAFVLQLQSDIKKSVGIPVSIGVSNTRIKAKIFSKLNKPYGVYIDLENGAEPWKNLPLKDIPFIGKKSQEVLKYKCNTIYDFIALGYRYIDTKLGSNGTNLWLELCGVNKKNYNNDTPKKSMSRGRSFNKHVTSDREYLKKQLLENFEYLFEEFSHKNKTLHGVGIFFRDKAFKHYAYRKNLFETTNYREKIKSNILKLWEENYNVDTLYRSVGVIFWGLGEPEFIQTNIFSIGDVKSKNKQKLQNILISINKKYKTRKVAFGMEFLQSGEGIKQRIFR